MSLARIAAAINAKKQNSGSGGNKLSIESDSGSDSDSADQNDAPFVHAHQHSSYGAADSSAVDELERKYNPHQHHHSNNNNNQSFGSSQADVSPESIEHKRQFEQVVQANARYAASQQQQPPPTGASDANIDDMFRHNLYPTPANATVGVFETRLTNERLYNVLSFKNPDDFKDFESVYDPNEKDQASTGGIERLKRHTAARKTQPNNSNNKAYASLRQYVLSI